MCWLVARNTSALLPGAIAPATCHPRILREKFVDDGVQIGAPTVEQANDRGYRCATSRLVPSCAGPPSASRDGRRAGAVSTRASVRGCTTSRARRTRCRAVREDRKRTGRHVTVGRRGHHVFDHAHLAVRQSARRRAGTRLLIVERTCVLPAAPRVKQLGDRCRDRRIPRSGTHVRAPIDSTQHPPLGESAALWFTA